VSPAPCLSVAFSQRHHPSFPEFWGWWPQVPPCHTGREQHPWVCKAGEAMRGSVSSSRTGADTCNAQKCKSNKRALWTEAPLWGASSGHLSCTLQVEAPAPSSPRSHWQDRWGTWPLCHCASPGRRDILMPDLLSAVLQIKCVCARHIGI
jgi:hypothetical protein